MNITILYKVKNEYLKKFCIRFKIDIFEDEERIVRRQKEDHLDSVEISKRLRPIIEKIYSNAVKKIAI